MSVMRTKSIEQSIADTDEPEYQLKKTPDRARPHGLRYRRDHRCRHLHADRRAASTLAGPADRAELRRSPPSAAGSRRSATPSSPSTVPVSGSAYTFSYASLGEIIAWIIGWDLLLELMLGASVVAQGWSTYAVVFLGNIGHHLARAPRDRAAASTCWRCCWSPCSPPWSPSASRSRCGSTWCWSAIKLFVVLFVIIAGIGFINAANYNPFIPPSVPAQLRRRPGTTAADPGRARLGAERVRHRWASSPARPLVFFAYIGFDVVATTAEEAKNPQRDLPIGILASLVDLHGPVRARWRW